MQPHSPEPGAPAEPRSRPSWTPWAPGPRTCRPRRPRPRPRLPPASPASPQPWAPWLAASAPSPGGWRVTFLSGEQPLGLLTAAHPLALRPASPLAIRLRPPASVWATSGTAGKGPKFEGSPRIAPSALSRGAELKEAPVPPSEGPECVRTGQGCRERPGPADPGGDGAQGAGTHLPSPRRPVGRAGGLCPLTPRPFQFSGLRSALSQGGWGSALKGPDWLSAPAF